MERFAVLSYSDHEKENVPPHTHTEGVARCSWRFSHIISWLTSSRIAETLVEFLSETSLGGVYPIAYENGGRSSICPSVCNKSCSRESWPTDRPFGPYLPRRKWHHQPFPVPWKLSLKSASRAFFKVRLCKNRRTGLCDIEFSVFEWSTISNVESQSQHFNLFVRTFWDWGILTLNLCLTAIPSNMKLHIIFVDRATTAWSTDFKVYHMICLDDVVLFNENDIFAYSQSPANRVYSYICNLNCLIARVASAIREIVNCLLLLNVAR